jgi:hypothetical protein
MAYSFSIINKLFRKRNQILKFKSSQRAKLMNGEEPPAQVVACAGVVHHPEPLTAIFPGMIQKVITSPAEDTCNIYK